MVLNLTKEQENEMICMHRTGKYTYEQLGKQFGISRSTAWKIVTNKVGKTRKYKKKADIQIDANGCKLLTDKMLDATTKLIEAMADYCLAFDIEDTEIVTKLFGCGLDLQDFIICGYGEFAKDCLNIKR